MMNLRQICRAVTSAFVLLQELTRRAEILVYLHLLSAFLAVGLGVYGVTVCEQMSLSPPLPKGRGRGIQIHAPHPGRSEFYAEQLADLFPRNKMDIGGLWIVVPIPVRYRRKDGGIYGHTQYGANNGVMLLGVQSQCLTHLFSGQILHTQEHRFQRMAARVNGDGRYLIHVNMNASFVRNSQGITQLYPLATQPPERIRRSYCRGSCGAISYRGGERAGVF